MIRVRSISLVAALLACVALVSADTLVLKDGEAIRGTYMGGDSANVKFLGADSRIATYPIDDVAEVRFGTEKTAEPVREEVAEVRRKSPIIKPDPTATTKTASGIEIPTGTEVTVRTIDRIEADAAGVGDTYYASIDEPIIIDDRVVIPRGADAKLEIISVEQAGKVKGSDEITLRLAEVTIDGQAIAIDSDASEVKGKNQTKNTATKTAIGAGIGAVIGAVIGGGKGAAIGAGTGAGAGAAVAILKGKTLDIPSETLLGFFLSTPLML